MANEEGEEQESEDEPDDAPGPKRHVSPVEAIRALKEFWWLFGGILIVASVGVGGYVKKADKQDMEEHFQKFEDRLTTMRLTIVEIQGQVSTLGKVESRVEALNNLLLAPRQSPMKNHATGVTRKEARSP